jgi:hypothetical protein
MHTADPEGIDGESRRDSEPNLQCVLQLHIGGHPVAALWIAREDHE